MRIALLWIVGQIFDELPLESCGIVIIRTFPIGVLLSLNSLAIARIRKAPYYRGKVFDDQAKMVDSDVPVWSASVLWGGTEMGFLNGEVAIAGADMNPAMAFVRLFIMPNLELWFDHP